MQSTRYIGHYCLRKCRQFSNFSALSQNVQPQVEKLAVSTPEGQVEKLVVPTPEGQTKPVPPKIEEIVSSITQLNLLEIAQLNEVLKKRLNLPDAPMFAMSTMGAVAAGPKEEEEEAAPQKVQINFTVKLLKYDEKQKVALIKEVKHLLEGMNLVQAKKFVESAPTVVKADIPKEEANKLQEALTRVGAVCEIV